MDNEELKNYMKAHKLRVIDVSVALGLHPSTVSIWRGGGRPMPKWAALAIKQLKSREDARRRNTIAKGLENYNAWRRAVAKGLESYNAWRRDSDGDLEPPNPAELGVLIDEAVRELKNN